MTIIYVMALLKSLESKVKDQKKIRHNDDLFQQFDDLTYNCYLICFIIVGSTR